MFGKGRQRQGMRRVPLAKAYRMVETVIISRREYPSHTHTQSDNKWTISRKEHKAPLIIEL